MAQRQKEKQKASTSAAATAEATKEVAEEASKIVPIEEEDVNSYTIIDKLEVKYFSIN